jgi:hypothetical protein
MAKPKVQTKFIVGCKSELESRIVLLGMNVGIYLMVDGRWEIDGKEADWVYYPSTMKEIRVQYPEHLYIPAQDVEGSYGRGINACTYFGPMLGLQGRELEIKFVENKTYRVYDAHGRGWWINEQMIKNK